MFLILGVVAPILPVVGYESKSKPCYVLQAFDMVCQLLKSLNKIVLVVKRTAEWLGGFH